MCSSDLGLPPVTDIGAQFEGQLRLTALYFFLEIQERAILAGARVHSRISQGRRGALHRTDRFITAKNH